MKKKRALLMLGVWIAILPYLGFPYAWKQVLFTASGLFVMYIAYLFYKGRKERLKREALNMQTSSVKFDSFSENSDFKGK